MFLRQIFKAIGGIRLKFSVLIPVYNTEKYLEECLQSVINQTYQNFEIIIVDDGSTDSSGKICDRYQRDYPDRIKVIHNENQGQLASRCIASQHAKGQYCIFMDSDDLLIDIALETIYINLEKFSFPDMLVYSFVYEKVNEPHVKADCLFEEGIVSQFDLYKMFLTGVGLNNVWTKAVKTEIAQCKDYDFSKYFSLRCSEDTLHSMAMIDQCQKIAYIYKPLYRYRIWENATTRRYVIDRIEVFNDSILFKERLRFAQKWGFNSLDCFKRIEANAINHLIYVFDLFYIHLKPKQRKKLMDYPWERFIPDEISIDALSSNEFLSKNNYNLLNWILHKSQMIISIILKQYGIVILFLSKESID